jgi:hypothetical protein
MYRRVIAVLSSSSGSGILRYDKHIVATAKVVRNLDISLPVHGSSTVVEGFVLGAKVEPSSDRDVIVVAVELG